MYSCCIRRIVPDILLGLGLLPRLLSFVVIEKLSSFLFISMCARHTPQVMNSHLQPDYSQHYIRQ
jgi:hypothetical protein